MRELELDYHEKLDEDKTSVKISVISAENKNLKYKFLLGESGKWTNIRDFSKDSSVVFEPEKLGEYTIMVQGREENSNAPYDYLGRITYTKDNTLYEEQKNDLCKERKAMETDVKLSPKITKVKADRKKILVGEEVTFNVDINYDNKENVLYKFMRVDEDKNIDVLQEYEQNNILSYKEEKSGYYKLLVAIKDAYSLNAYDDRAAINYKVLDYEPLEIIDFSTDVKSPKEVNSNIRLSAKVQGGKKILYRYIIEGKENIDSGYITEKEYLWKPTEEGQYNLRLFAKDKSCTKEYEVKKEIQFTVKQHITHEAIIKEIINYNNDKVLVNEKVNYKVNFKYKNKKNLVAFAVKQNGKLIHRSDFSRNEEIEYIPNKKGKYEVEISVRHLYSEKKYDAHEKFYFEVYDFIPCYMDKIVVTTKKPYVANNEIKIETIVENSKEALVKYEIRINGYLVEQSEYIKNKDLSIAPRYGGNYNITIYSKNLKSLKEFEGRESIEFYVNDFYPIENIKINLSEDECSLNRPIEFNVSLDGGNLINYQFYIKREGEWYLVQDYSRKNYYTYIPVDMGKQQIMVLCKNEGSKKQYEEYSILEFEVV